MTSLAQKPILFVDVDGVLSLFGFGEEHQVPDSPMHWVNGIAHCIPPATGPRLARLAERFELVWATGWEELANEYLPLILDLPFDRLPCLGFGGRAVFGSSHWKVDAIDEYAGDRPAAWIDDNLDEIPRRWAVSRGVPTMLVETSSHEGLTDGHVDALLAWADDVEALARAPQTHAA